MFQAQAILSKCVRREAVSLAPSAMLPNVHDIIEAHQPLHAFGNIDPLVFLVLSGNIVDLCKATISP